MNCFQKQDMNDKAPRFTKNVYFVSTFENTPPGKLYILNSKKYLYQQIYKLLC